MKKIPKPDPRFESTSIINESISEVPDEQEPDIETGNVSKKSGIVEVDDYNLYSSIIVDSYMGNMTYYSITLDLIALYLKGQKLLYVESKQFCEHCLHTLMLPAIFISATCTVLSMALKPYSYGAVLVSTLTGLNSFILAVVTYLKLDAKAEAHKTSAYQFDKLQTLCEFYSGKTLMLKDDLMKEKVTKFIEIVEQKVAEIKDVNQFIIPEVIRFRYSIIYSYNVFAVMKEYKTKRVMDTQRLINVSKLIAIKQDVNPPSVPEQVIAPDGEIKKKGKFMDFFSKEELVNNNIPLDIYNADYQELCKERNKIIESIIEYRNISIKLNKEFCNIIENHVTDRRKRWFKCFLLKT